MLFGLPLRCRSPNQSFFKKNGGWWLVMGRNAPSSQTNNTLIFLFKREWEINETKRKELTFEWNWREKREWTNKAIQAIHEMKDNWFINWLEWRECGDWFGLWMEQHHAVEAEVNEMNGSVGLPSFFTKINSIIQLNWFSFERRKEIKLIL